MPSDDDYNSVYLR